MLPTAHVAQFFRDAPRRPFAGLKACASCCRFGYAPPWRRRVWPCSWPCARPGAVARAQPPAPAQDLAHPQGTNAGIFAFTGRCAGCHDTGKDGAQDRYTLNRRTPEEVLASITTGSMAQVRAGTQ